MAYHNISMRELSKRSGIHVTTLQRMKKTGEFSFCVIDKICQTLNLNIKDIMRYEE
jgi:DNA-binding Xre family transcriptional regulator